MEDVRKIKDRLSDARCAVEYVLTQGISDTEEEWNFLNLCGRLSDTKTMIVSAFPGCGKTFLFNNNDKIILDSSKFDKAFFPQNYIEHIKENIGKADIILVSSHKEVRAALFENKIDFILVYPRKELKEEYIKRYEQRGSPEGFINLISNNWTSWVGELSNQKGCYHCQLSTNQYISDII